ncbi:acyl-CoA N-acyltransferase [Marasmius fiardii PR-910]|nr:acyl-CoA N-acyltransferase [Marasmius fiardii PR-910]
MGGKGHSEQQQQSLNISVRVFSPEDLSEVQKLFIESRTYGSGSPLRLGIRLNMLTPIAYGFYATFFIGTCLRQRNPDGYLRLLGTSLIFSSLLFIVGTVFPIGMFVFFGFRALYRGDMKDVATHYQLRESQKDTSASSFWVAEVDAASGKQIVGCIGLDCFTNDDPTEGELRRMLVSPAFRGHGIAKKLMSALLEHARDRGLKQVFLSTTALNDKAVVMYMKTGWELVRKQVFSAGFVKGETFDFRMKLEG